jgi:polyisoprenoid-binding protein YceI
MSAVSSETHVYGIDPAHTSVEFSVKHLVISKVRGRFSGISGTISLADSNVPAAVDVEIDATSVDTREAQRDGHLKSPDFLDAEKFPALIYKSTRISGAGPQFTIDGQLTLHGVTKPVSLSATVDGRTTDPWGNDRIAYSAEGTIDRRDFGLVWNQALEAGGFAVGYDVKLDFSVQAVRAK